MTQPATSLAWVETAKPAGARTSVTRLQDAAMEMLTEETWEQSSVLEIARRAGTSPATFRARFRDKDALLRSVHERYVSEAAATADAVLAVERWEGCSMPEIIREMVVFAVQLFRERAGMIRVFLSRTAIDEDFRERAVALSRHIGELLRKLVLSRRRELLHPAPAIAAEFSTRLIQGMLRDRTLTGEQGETGSIKLSDEQMTTELIHAVLAYLGVFSTHTWDS